MSSTGTDQAMNSSTTSSVSAPSGPSTSTAMDTAAADSYSFALSTLSASSQAIHIPRPRNNDLPEEEWVKWHEYNHYFYVFKDHMSLHARQARARISSQLTEEQKRLFPVLCEEEQIICDLHEVRFLQVELYQLVDELKLEAENDIDHERGRC